MKNHPPYVPTGDPETFYISEIYDIIILNETDGIVLRHYVKSTYEIAIWKRASPHAFVMHCSPWVYWTFYEASYLPLKTTKLWLFEYF